MRYFQQICCFMLIAETFMKLCPNKKYEEYIRMITGFICLLLVVTPILLFFKNVDRGKLPALSELEVELQKVLEESERKMEEELEGKFKEGGKVDEETWILEW